MNHLLSKCLIGLLSATILTSAVACTGNEDIEETSTIEENSQAQEQETLPETQTAVETEDQTDDPTEAITEAPSEPAEEFPTEENPDETVASDPEETTDPSPMETEPETQMPLPPADFEVTEEGDTANVSSPSGLTYTVSGYETVDGGAFSFSDTLTIQFPADKFTETFNRLTLSYDSTAPVKIVTTYLTDGVEHSDDYFLEAASGNFSGVVNGFIDDLVGASLTRLTVTPILDGTVLFSLQDAST